MSISSRDWSIELYIDLNQIILKPYVHKILFETKEQVDYYGFRKAYIFNFLVFVLEISYF
jgi:hypothetical protein